MLYSVEVRLHCPTLHSHLVPDGVEGQPATADHRRVHAARPPLERAHAGQQLPEVEGFDEVVVRAASGPGRGPVERHAR